MSDALTTGTLPPTRVVMGSLLLSDADAVVEAIAPGSTVDDVTLAHRHPRWEADTKLCAAVNGAPVDGSRVIEDGDCLTLAPEYEVTGLIAIGIFLLKVIVLAVISYGLSLLMNKWFGPDTPAIETDQDTGKPTYGWNGPRTLYTQGQPAPIVFGEFQTGGSVVSYYITQDGSKSYLNVLVLVSDSEIEAIGGVDRELDGATGASIPEDIWVGGRRLNTYRKVLVWTRLGKTNQRAIPGFNDKTIQYPIEIPLKIGFAKRISYTTRGEVDRVDFKVEYPDGLVEQAGSDGNLFSVLVVHKFRHRVVNDNGTFGAWSADTSWQYRGKSSARFTRERDIRMPARARYEFEWWRTSALVDADAGRSKSTLDSAVEIQFRDFEYPRGAFVAIKALATAGLNTNRPQLRIGYKGTLVDIWTGSGYERQYSANPWWIVLWFLRDEERALGSELRNIQLPLTDFIQAASEADALVHTGIETFTGGYAEVGTNRLAVLETTALKPDDVLILNEDGATEETVTIHEIVGLVVVLKELLASRHVPQETVAVHHEKYRFDGQFDENGNAWESLQRVAKTARGTVIKLGNRVVLKRAVISEPMLIINEGNVRNVSLSYVNPRSQSNEWRAQFVRENELGLYETDTMVIQDRDAILHNASEDAYYQRTTRVTEDVQLIGIKRPPQIRRDLKFRQRMVSNSDTILTFEIPIEGIGTFPGSVFAFAHYLVGRGDNGRILAAVASGGSSFTADREIVLAAATTHMLVLRADDDTVNEFTITSPAATYARGDAISISGTFGKASALHSPYIVGPLLPGPTIEYEITNWSFTPDVWLKIEAINYNDDTYTDPPNGDA